MRRCIPCCRSPQHDPLQSYFEQEVSKDTHILYAGATRFGWGGQRQRYSYSLLEVRPTSLCGSLLFTAAGEQRVWSTA